MKLPKGSRKENNNKNSEVKTIKKLYPVHPITCEHCNKLIPCPSCNEKELLRGWKLNGRTLALCYYCGTLFFADNDEIVRFFNGDREFWGAKAIGLSLQLLNRNKRLEIIEKIIVGIINTLMKYDDESELQLYIFSDDNLIFSKSYILKLIHNDPEFGSVLKTAIMNNDIIAIMLKTQLTSNFFEIRSLRVHNRKIKRLSSNELKACFSVDSQTGMPINPPKNYVFKEFNQM